MGYICSFEEKCEELDKLGYKNLNFCNGGDDDWLVIDHDTKTYGFFEDYVPCQKQILKAKTLTELWAYKL
jgi:hypothetical protein